METIFTYDRLQEKFESSIMEEHYYDEDFDYIEKNHYGDFLIEKYEDDNNERYKLWKNHPENGGQIEIEYSGAANGHRWETVYKS